LVARKCDPILLCMTRVWICSVPVCLGLSNSVIRETLLSLQLSIRLVVVVAPIGI
jgi:hypothetical protein